MRTRSRTTRAVLALGIALALSVPAAASAAQQQNANAYAYWSWTGSPFWNVDQYIRIDKSAPATFWAQNLTWRGRSDGAYLGIQTNGTFGRTGIFSIWNANGAQGSHCLRFGGEGSGWSCRISFPFHTGRWYRLRIWRLQADAKGQWWGAWIYSPTTGKDHHIGNIRAPKAATQIGYAMNFTEYFGTAVPCNRVPSSWVFFTQPAANYLGGGRYEFGSTYHSARFGSCTRGTAVPGSSGGMRGVELIHGST